MQTFVSSALGQQHEYRSWFSDQVGLVLLARSPAQVGGDLLCRPKGDTGDYKQVFHTHSEVMQVLSDFDAAELKSRRWRQYFQGNATHKETPGLACMVRHVWPSGLASLIWVMAREQPQAKLYLRFIFLS